jgi:acetyl esterase/lipase
VLESLGQAGQVFVMNYSKLVTVIGCAVVLGQATALESRHEKTFREWDKNKDKKLTKAELPVQNQRNFNLVDADKDGFISFKEHVVFLSSPRNQNNRDWSGFKIIKDIAYAGTSHDRQTLDLALPLKRRNDKPLPVIAYIHGGAWRAGSKNGGLNRLHDFLKTGKYAGVSIGYRLSQQVKWPAQIHDCKAAIRWIKANAKKYGLDGDRIAVHGTSAGGHLVAMLGTSAGVETMDGAIGPHGEQSTRVQCVIDYYGPTNFLRMNDFESRIDHDAVDSPESQLIGGAIQENKKQTLTADPISYVDKGDVPFLIMHGTKDMLVPYNQSVLLHNALQKAGVSSILLTVEGGGHGGGKGVLPERFRAFVEFHLHGKKGIIDDETIPVAKVKQR